jgi:hypothetical protein
VANQVEEQAEVTGPRPGHNASGGAPAGY